MKIAVVGAGGVGGYFGGLLAKAGYQVSFISRGEHLRALKERGLQIKSPIGDIRVSNTISANDPKEVGQVDYVINDEPPSLSSFWGNLGANGMETVDLVEIID